MEDQIQMNFTLNTPGRKTSHYCATPQGVTKFEDLTKRSSKSESRNQTPFHGKLSSKIERLNPSVLAKEV